MRFDSRSLVSLNISPWLLLDRLALSQKKSTHRLDNKLERNAVGLGWLSVKVECIDEALILLHVQLLIGNLLGIQRDVLVQPRNIGPFWKLSVNFAGISLVDADCFEFLII